ncbi:MAG: tetratricopeptide repeat protein [Armatimonadetes bacterium]|nr:tetratricopeptide repeat protein [Armatimonadota bacterium]
MTIEQLQGRLQEAKEQNRQGQYAKAEEIAQEVMQQCGELQGKEKEKDIDRLRVIGNLLIGETLWRRGHSNEAIPFAEAARTCSEKLKSIEYSIHYRLLFATIYLRISEYKTALSYIDEAEAIATEHGREEDLVRVKSIKGEFYREVGPMQEAATIFNEVIESATLYGMDDYVAVATKNLGVCYIFLGEYDKALELCESSLEMYKALNNVIGQATAMANIGAVYLVQGEYLLSMKWLQEELQLIQDIDIKPFKGIIYVNMGHCYRGMGDLQKSLEYYQIALEIQQQCNDQRNISNILGNIAILYRQLERYDLAEVYFEKTFEILIRKNGSNGGEFLGNYAIMLYEQKQYKKAEEYLTQIISSFQESKQVVQECQYSFYICQIYIHNNEFDKAKRIALRSYQVFCEHSRNDEIPNSLRLLGQLYANPDFTEYNVALAEQYYLQSIEKFLEVGNKHGVYTATHHIAQFYKQQNRWEEYAANIEKAIEVYKEVQTEAVQKQADRFGWEQKIAEMEKAKEIEKIRAEAEAKKLEQQLASQQREVEITVHELVNKNNLLHEVRKDVRELSKHIVREGHDVVERLIGRLERNIIPLEDKLDLEQQWSEVHGQFMNLLKKQYPTLTTMELKICALLKMKLTSSNICSILFLSKRTIEFHRLNIRKKMRLGKQDDLYLVMNSPAES